MALLARLRRGIRAYAWTEGIALLVAVLAGEFLAQPGDGLVLRAPRRAARGPAGRGRAGAGLGAVIGSSCGESLSTWPTAAWPWCWNDDSASFETACVTAVELSQTPADTAGFDPQMLARDTTASAWPAPPSCR